VFKKEWLKVIPPFFFAQKRLNRYVTCDLAFSIVDENTFRRKAKRVDYSVVLTVAIDEAWNFTVEDWFREQCAISEVVEELYRQWDSHHAVKALIQQYDVRGIRETIEQRGFEFGRTMPVEWVQYPPGQDESFGSYVGKQARIRALLEPKFRAKKIFLKSDMLQWFANEEYLDFPRSKARSWDTMDALCNVVRFGRPPVKTRIMHKLSQEEREVKALMGGRDPDSPTADPYWDTYEKDWWG
jgi:hypothetical protein